MGTEQVAVILIGSLAGGFVSGLAGFGTGITALGLWLHVLEPAVAASLVVICSVLSQVQSLPAIRREINPQRVLPFIIPGLIGVPFGAFVLLHLDARIMKIGVGALLIIFSAVMLVLGTTRPFAWGGKRADAVVGLCAGILGGAVGLSGPLPTMWAALRGWAKGESRSVFQSFNLAILSTALVVHVFSGFITTPVLIAVLVALPGSFLGTAIGVWAYARLSDRRFRDVILLLLTLSGVMLVWMSL